MIEVALWKKHIGKKLKNAMRPLGESRERAMAGSVISDRQVQKPKPIQGCVFSRHVRCCIGFPFEVDGVPARRVTAFTPFVGCG
jgi:hypothetical protein